MDEVTELLENSRVIAVVGMSNLAHRDSYWVGEFLMNQGYTVYPVNPRFNSIFGLKSYPNLQSVPEKIDIVDVFRNPAFARDIVKEAIAAEAKAIWFQLGAEEEEAERMARKAGLEVVSGLCIAVEFRRRRIVKRPFLRTDRLEGRGLGNRMM